MAVHLESLVSHYGQMAGALRDNEAGEVFSEEDMQGRLQVLVSLTFISPIYFTRHEPGYG